MQIKPDKIGDVIGPKGKTIRGIQDATGAKISIEDTGVVTISPSAARQVRRPGRWSQRSPPSPKGRTYEGPGQEHDGVWGVRGDPSGVEGLLHISELQHGRTEKTEDVVKKGDIVQVKLLEVDDRGRMKLSRKALLPRD